MSSQFTFLTTDFPEIVTNAVAAERAARSDPRAACLYARLVLEVTVNWMFARDVKLRAPYETTLAARINEPTFQQVVGQGRFVSANIIRNLGNAAVHETRAVAADKAIASVRELFNFTFWLARTYGKTQPDPDLAFNPDALPQTKQVAVSTLAQLQDIAKNFESAMTALDLAKNAATESADKQADLEAELAATRAEIAAIKAANAANTDTHDYDEAATRNTFIDLLLIEAGWPLNQSQDREFRVTGMPNNAGEGFVDYVLWGDDGKPLGVVEAKSTRKNATVGQQQAKLYADCLEAMFGQRPIIFYTNGYEHWLWDDVTAPPRRVAGFYTIDELQLFIQRRTTRKSPSDLEVNTSIVERYYQHRAIRRVVESYDRDGLRKALLVMATGSGKTRTVIALCDLLLRANWVKRVLFLADRVALVRQAVNAFKTHLPTAPTVNLVTDKDATGRIYVSTYPTMMGLIDEDIDGIRKFGVGHFDLIVIDEAHRSIYSKYGEIFSYFDSLLIGLTATPKDEVDRDTYRLFNLPKGVPTDVYDLKQAVDDAYLVRADGVSVPLQFQDRGITYDDLPDDEKEAWDDIEWSDDNHPPPTKVESSAINSWLFNTDTVDKALEYLMTHGLTVAGGDRLGKTIIFAKNHDHAQFIVERFDVAYPHLKGSFARVIDVKTEYAQSLIDDFSIPEKAPHIAVSVDMLDTGIDIPEIVNLVFFKIVRSKTKFWQMLGRGTRLRADLFGPGFPKQFFKVFDFCKNFEFFNQDPQIADTPIADSLSKKLFTARVDLISQIALITQPDDTTANLGQDTASRLQAEVASMTPDNFIVRPKLGFVTKFSDAATWKDWTPAKSSELVTEVAGLPSTLVDNDLEAKTFDLLILRTQLALLRSETSFLNSKDRIKELAGLLENVSNIPLVKTELAFIVEVQTVLFWEDITVAMLENVRKKLRSLIKLIDKQKRVIIYTDFTDEIGTGVSVDIIGIPIGTDMERFRAKARQFLLAHPENLSVAKVRRNDPLTSADIIELERIFQEAGIASADELKALSSPEGLGIFVRSLIGLDRIAAKEAFNVFLVGRTLSANQLEFVNMLIEHLTARGAVDPALLYQSPFTDLNPLGVSGLFSDNDAARIVDILARVRKNAAA